jgi:hypothetical protein
MRVNRVGLLLPRGNPRAKMAASLVGFDECLAA